MMRRKILALTGLIALASPATARGDGTDGSARAIVGTRSH